MPIDNCNEIKKQQADPKYQAVMEELKDPATLKLHKETGYWQDNQGNFHQMATSHERHVDFPLDRSNLVNSNHVHTEDWINPLTGKVVSTYAMPSREDIVQVYETYDVARSHGLNLANTYIGNINTLGSFQMRFVGNSDYLSSSKVQSDKAFIF